MRARTMAGAVSVVAAVGLAAAGCGAAHPRAVTTPDAGHSAPTTAAMAHVGAVLSLDGGRETVQVTQVIDPAQGGDQFTTPDPGKRFVAVGFTIRNTGSTAGQGDANNNASVVGSDGQTYSPNLDTVAECTDFDSGSFTLAAGESASGCVTFQVPAGVKVAEVKWTPEAGLAADFGEWQVP